MDNEKTVKIANADLAVGRVVNVAICERIFDRHGDPLSDSIVDTVDCVIRGVGAHWSDQPHGQSGRYYAVEPIEPLPVARAGRQIILGI